MLHFSSAAADAQEATERGAGQIIVSIQSINELRQQAADSAELNDESKSKIESICVQTLDDLTRLAQTSQQAETFKRETDNVPARVAALRQSLVKLQRDKPSPMGNLTLSKLEQEVSLREAQLAELKAAQAKSELEPSTRANRRREIRSQLLSASQRLSEVQNQLDTAAPADEPILLTRARKAALVVSRMQIEAEQPALQHELACYDAEDAADVLRLERDLAARRVSLADSELEILQSQLSRQRAADSAAAVRRARTALSEAPVHLKIYAEANVALAEAADSLSGPIETERRKLDSAQTRLEQVRSQFTMTAQRVQDIGLTGSVGALLRRQRTDLPDLRRRQKNVQDRRSLIEDTQYELFEYDDQRAESIDAGVRRIVQKFDLSQSNLSDLRDAVRTIVQQRREYLDGVIRSYNTYLDTLFDLDATEQRLIKETERYRNYIDERVMWIRSNRTLLTSFGVDASDTWALDSARWSEVGLNLREDFRTYPWLYATALGVFGWSVWRKRHYRRELEAVSQIAARRSCTDFAPTMRATFVTAILAIGWPGIVFFAAWRLNASAGGSEFTRALASALFVVSWVYFPLELLRRVCRPLGLADSHFGWPSSTVSVIRSNLQWATYCGLIVVFVTGLLFASDLEHGFDAVERVSFVAGMLLLSVLLWRVTQPQIGVFRNMIADSPGGWLDLLGNVLRGACVLTPLAIGGMAIAGYYYTAQQLTWRFYASFVLVTTVQVIRAFLQRLLTVRHRSLSIEQARERRIAESESREQSGETSVQSLDQIVPQEELLPDVTVNSEQTRTLIRTGVIAASLIGLWLIWVDVLPALRILDQWSLWTTTVPTEAVIDNNSPSVPGLISSNASGDGPGLRGQGTEQLRSITVADLSLAVLIGIVTFVCARNIPGFMEMSILQRLPLDNSIRYAVKRVTSYMLVLLGVILAFNAIAVGWSKVQWLATALTFGLAFGLQEIFANFVAGLILLFERPIRVGDVVTVDDITGVVSRIRIRATTITTWERKEYVIPNKEFITGRTLNWTLSDKTNRIVINVGIAYGSDVRQAKDILLKTCNEHPLIVDDPPTFVTFEGFGDNSLNLVVRTFLPDLENRLPVVDELHTAIDDAFREASIEIAFPQRDLHIRSVDRGTLDDLVEPHPS